MMIRDLRVLRYFPLVLAASMLVCGLIWLGAGIGVKAQVLSGAISPLQHPDQAVTVFLDQLAPAWLASLAYVGIVAAVMSTVDSFAGVGAVALTRDLPRAVGRGFKNELLWGRICTVLLFLLAILFSFLMKELVAYLGILAFGVFAAIVTPSIALGLNWNAAGRWAARGSVSAGILCTLLLEGAIRLGVYPFSVPPALLALGVSLLVFLLLGSAVDSRQTGKSLR
jgi:Na+/proline symporter